MYTPQPGFYHASQDLDPPDLAHAKANALHFFLSLGVGVWTAKRFVQGMTDSALIDLLNLHHEGKRPVEELLGTTERRRMYEDSDRSFWSDGNQATRERAELLYQLDADRNLNPTPTLAAKVPSAVARALDKIVQYDCYVKGQPIIGWSHDGSEYVIHTEEEDHRLPIRFERDRTHSVTRHLIWQKGRFGVKIARS